MIHAYGRFEAYADVMRSEGTMPLLVLPVVLRMETHHAQLHKPDLILGNPSLLELHKCRVLGIARLFDRWSEVVKTGPRCQSYRLD